MIILFITLIISTQVMSQQWSIEYPLDENETAYFIVGDMSGEYNYSIGYKMNKMTGVTHPVALCIDEEGFYKDKVYDDIVTKGFFCCAMGLDDGNLFVAARCGDNESDEIYEKLWVAIINTDLEIINDNYLYLEHPYISFGYTMHVLMDNKGEIVVVCQITDDIPQEINAHYDYAFYKMNTECDLLNYSYLENVSRHCNITDFTLVPNTDLYAVFGNGMRPNGVETIFYVDENLNYRYSDIIDNANNYPNLLYPEFMCVDHWFDDNHFLMSMQSSKTSGDNEWCPLVLKMDRQMNVIDRLSLERQDTTDYVSQYRSMVYVDSTTIYISTYQYNDMDDILPNTAMVYRINDNLDILGMKKIDVKEFLNILYIQPTYDKGCIIQGFVDDGSNRRTIICKLSESDFETNESTLQDKTFFDMKVYPNPVSSFLYIEQQLVKGDCVSVKIYDMLGRRYLERGIIIDGTIITIDVASLENGVYFYQIDGNDNCIKNVFIKE